jgi:hypothetical protein
MQALELEKERTRAAEADARAAEADSRAALAEARAATAERDLLLAKQGSLAAPDYGAEEALHPRTDQWGSSSQSVGEREEESGNDGTEADAQDEDENAEKPAAKGALQVCDVLACFRIH